MHHQKKGLRVSIVLVATMACVGNVSAQEWPTRPVTMVAPAAAGSSTDVVARILTPRLSEVLGQQVIVENLGGAGGMTGTARVARAAPDGYQMVLGFAGTHAINQSLYKHPLYNAATDFAPVALIANLPIVLIARKDLPVGSLQEFMAYTRANHAKMQYGSPGVGSTVHLACEMLNAAMGVNVTHIPYRGGGPAMQDLIAGRIDYQCVASTIAISQIESKSVKAISVFTPRRSPVLPAVATADESGLTNFEANTWYGLFLPKGTPAAIVKKLHNATVATMESPVVEARLKEIGGELVAPEQRSPEYLAKFVASEIDKWAKPIKAIGISAD